MKSKNPIEVAEHSNILCRDLPDEEEEALKAGIVIYRRDGSVSFTGRLQSVTLGNSLFLTWDGNMADRPGQPAKFVGVGYQIDHDLMVASFEQTE